MRSAIKKKTGPKRSAAANEARQTDVPGWFDVAAREYVIQTPHLPGPWINYLGYDETLCGMISHTAGGSAWFRDCLKNRILRYHQIGSSQDSPGRYLYVRDAAIAQAFCPTVQPVSQAKPDSYECRHGLGYTRIKTAWQGLAFDTLHLIDPRDGVEVQALTIRNATRRRRKLAVFAYREFVSGDVLDEVVRPAIRNYTIDVSVDRKAGVIYNLTGRTLVNRDKPIYYFASVAPIAGFDTDCRSFLGDGQLHDPQAVRDGRCCDSVSRSNDAIGVHQVDVDLPAGAETTLIFLLGAIEQPIAQAADVAVSAATAKCVRAILRRWRRSPQASVAQSLRTLRANYEGLLSVMQCSLPPGDSALENMVNTWNPYGVWTNFRFSRSLSDHASGISRPMLGTRDSAQDLYGLVQLNAPAARRRIIDWLSLAQRADGSCFHHFSPTDRRSDGVTGYSDDHLWIVKAVSIYLKETGDFALLSQRVGFADQPDDVATVWAHLLKPIEYTTNHLGSHGVPLMLTADWNNVFAASYAQNAAEKSLRERAESTLVGMMLVAMAKDLVEIAEAHIAAQPAAAQSYRSPVAFLRQVAAAQADALNRHAWFDNGRDEGWYARGSDPQGRFFGVPDDREGRLFLLPQAWALMAGVAGPNRSEKLLRAIRRHLYQPGCGLLLVDPPYTLAPPLGSFNVYPPGSRENGAIFCHAHAMAVAGIARAADGDFVSELHAALLPPLASTRMGWRKYSGPPYAYCQFRYGPRHALAGQARGSWLTGTVAWSYYGACQWLLGIRPEFGGLVIDPRVSSAWREYRITRAFRGAVYDITVKNPDGASAGVDHLVVDGQRVEGNLLPIFTQGTHRVEAWMTRKR